MRVLVLLDFIGNIIPERSSLHVQPVFTDKHPNL